MATGNLKISHNFTGETGYIIAVPKKTTAPLADVVCIIDGVVNQTRKVYSVPHTQRSMLIEGLEFEWYTVKFYRSVDGVALGAEILTIAGNAATGVTYSTTKYEYVVDRGNSGTTPGAIWADPISDTIELRDERLKDKVYYIEERGTGFFMDSEFTDRSDLNGGFDLTDGRVFEPEKVYVVLVVNKIDAQNSSVVSGDGYTDVLELNSNDDFDPVTMFGKILVANWPGIVGTLTFPDFSLIPNGKFRINTNKGAQRNVILQFNVGNTIWFLSEQVNKIVLGKSEWIEIMFKNNVPYVIGEKTNHELVGQRVLSDYLSPNKINADGTLYNQTDVPRIMWYVEKLPASEVITEAQWIIQQNVNGENVFINKSKYARDDINGTIRVPDDRDKYFRALKFLDNTNNPESLSQGVGGYMHNQNKSHTHTAKDSWHLFGTQGRGNLSASSDAVKQTSGNRTQDGLNTSGGNEARPNTVNLIPSILI
jgi:hypothetical protein